jgi:tRNA modification GTPase
VEHQSPLRRRQRAREALSPTAAPPADTIVAAATPPGRGGVAVVRVSGPRVPAMLPTLLGATAAARVAANPRLALNAVFHGADGGALDSGLALYFPAPHSYTGEDVLELHGHGGPVPVEALIRRALELGARRAQPGEFTQRAYLNEKLDLAQAEAVASLIDAASDAAARAALRSLQGQLSQRVLALAELIGALRARVEAAIDFADEDIEALSEPALRGQLAAVTDELHRLQAQCRQGRVLTEGLRIVIAGRPNAGKSTLLNRLAGHDAAIVTPLPGTTRDILREHVLLDGLPLQVLDTAGLRDLAADAAATAGTAADAIEAEGIRRARAAMADADRILFVIDAADDPDGDAYRAERARLPAGVPVTLVFNKIDQAGTATAVAAPAAVRLSALTGAGIEQLTAHLKDCAGFTTNDSGVISARARHLEALERVDACLALAREQLQARRAPELVAEELRHAQRALGEIVGVEDSDALLGRIFATFCIGK